MSTKVFKPESKYLVKMFVLFTLLFIVILLGGMLLGFLIALDDGGKAFFITMTVFLIGDLLWYIPAMLLATPYYRSLRYEIKDITPPTGGSH